jgi:ketosteroid isomerase-like protein
VINLEHISNIIANSLMEFSVKKIQRRPPFSLEEIDVIAAVHAELLGSLQLAVAIFLSGDPGDATRLVERKVSLRRMEVQATALHVRLLRDAAISSRAGDGDSLGLVVEESGLFLRIVCDLRRIHSHIATFAFPVLNRIARRSSSSIERLRACIVRIATKTPRFDFCRMIFHSIRPTGVLSMSSRLNIIAFATTGLALMLCEPVTAGAPRKLTAEQAQIVDTVSTIFTAARTDDVAKFDSVIAPDFYIFDVGARFNGDSIMALIKAQHLAGKRYEWNVTEPDVHISGKTAWVAYVNKGSIGDAAGTVNQDWLESAFLQKQAGVWKIVFMHSTRVTMPTQQNPGK